jgi:PKD repeat protein
MVTDADSDSAVFQRVITVYAYMIPTFTVNTTSTTVNQTIQFTDTTTGGKPALSYQWNFGDGTANSTLQNPTHKFATNGTFTVTLTVTDAESNVVVSQKIITVTAASTTNNTVTQNYTTLIIIIVVAIVVGAMIGVFVILNKRKMQNDKKQKPPEETKEEPASDESTTYTAE